MLKNIDRSYFQIPKYIEQQKNEIGFGIYEYIDFKELQKTILRDYTEVIVKFNLLILVLSIIGGLVGSIVGFLLIVSIFYLIVFIYLFIKLILRIKLFVALNKIIITNQGIIAGDSVFEFSDKNFLNYLSLFEEEFDEFLFKPSKLDNILQFSKQKMLDKLLGNASYLGKGINYIGGLNGDSVKLLFVSGLFMILYNISVYIFYYFGYIFVYIFGKILIFFVKLYLKIRGNIEFKIYTETLNIYNDLNKLELLNGVIKNRFNNFNEGEIFNLGKFINSKFSNFYAIILGIFKKKEKLYFMTEKSKYKDYIDFNKLKVFIKNKFNEPVDGMIQILENYISMINKQLLELDSLLIKQNKPEYIGNLKIKKRILKDQIIIMKSNLSRLKKMKII